MTPDIRSAFDDAIIKCMETTIEVLTEMEKEIKRLQNAVDELRGERDATDAVKRDCSRDATGYPR